MKKLPLAQILATLIIAVSAWGAFLVPSAYANIITAQEVNSYKSTNTFGVPNSIYSISANGVYTYTGLGTGLLGIPKSLSIKLSEDFGFSGTENVYLFEYSGTASTTYTGNGVRFDFNFTSSMPATIINSATTTYIGTWSSATALDPTKYYALVYRNNASQVPRVWGTSSGSFNYTCANAGGFTCDTSLKSPFYELYDNTAVAIGIPTITTVTPTQNQIFAYPYTVNFTGAYSHTAGLDFYDSIGFTLVDVNTLASYSIATGTIASSGNYSFSLTLPVNHAFQYYPYLFAVGSSTYPTLQGTSIFFTTGTSTGLVGSISPNTNDFSSFFNVPQLLATRAPFAYFYLTAVTLQNLNTFATSSIPTGSFDVAFPYGNASTTLHVDMFSTTTIGYFLNQSMIDILRGLMVAITYGAMGLYLYRRGSTIIT